MTEAEARAERNALITASDWTQVADAPLTQNERARWREYRQRLRDVPQQPGFPASVEWPAEPEKDPEIEYTDQEE
jgi:hypothetical protein